MALVYRAPKLQGGAGIAAGQQRLGPGAYSPENGSIKNSLEKVQKKGIKSNHKISRKGRNRETKQQKKVLESVGPGKYEIDEAHKKFLTRIKPSECSSAFRSQLKRFQNPTEERYRQMEKLIREDEQKMMYEILLNKKDDQRAGKLYGIRRDPLRASQSIPSIPNINQSYGYRFDNQTKKLVLNENPRVLLAKRSGETVESVNLAATLESIYQGPNSYFVKYNSHVKGPKWHKSQLEKRLEGERNVLMEENESRIMQIHRSQLEEKKNCLLVDDERRWKSKGNPLSNKDERFSHSQCKAEDKKRLLLLNNVRRKFERFVGEAGIMEVQKILQDTSAHRQLRITDGQCSHNKGVECFMSKEQRFITQSGEVQLKTVGKYEQIQLIKTAAKESNNGKSGDEKKTVKPFMTGVRRFADSGLSINKNIGPGSYEAPEACSRLTQLKRTQKRFNDCEYMNGVPGPGQYHPEQIKHESRVEGQKPRQLVHKTLKEMSCQPLYLHLGSENSSSPQEVINVDPKNIPQSAGYKSATPYNVHRFFLKEVQNILTSEVRTTQNLSKYEGSHSKPARPQLRKPQKRYHAPVKQEHQLGPGSFEVNRELIRKTYNVTYS